MSRDGKPRISGSRMTTSMDVVIPGHTGNGGSPPNRLTTGSGHPRATHRQHESMRAHVWACERDTSGRVGDRTGNRVTDTHLH